VYYPSDAYYAFAKRPRARRRWRAGIRTLVLHLHYGYETPNGFARLPRAMRRIARLITLPVKGRYRDVPPRTWGSTLLDVGCGAGEYLDVMRELGWETSGVEPNESAARAASESGHILHHGVLTGAPFSPRSFDVVRMWHTLEHLPDPLADLRTAAALLRPGGHLVLGTPNSAGLAAGIFGRYWFHLDAPRHLCIFSTRAVERRLGEVGLSEIRVQTYAQLADIQYSYQFWRQRRRGGAARRTRPRQWMVLAALPILAALGRLGAGDLLRVTARKKRAPSPAE